MPARIDLMLRKAIALHHRMKIDAKSWCIFSIIIYIGQQEHPAPNPQFYNMQETKSPQIMPLSVLKHS